MKMDAAAARTSKPLPQAQLPVQAAANTNINIPQTARESDRPLPSENILPFVDPVFFSFFPQYPQPTPKASPSEAKLTSRSLGLTVGEEGSDKCG